MRRDQSMRGFAQMNAEVRADRACTGQTAQKYGIDCTNSGQPTVRLRTPMQFARNIIARSNPIRILHYGVTQPEFVPGTGLLLSPKRPARGNLLGPLCFSIIS
jgi:hypothetical protein